MATSSVCSDPKSTAIGFRQGAAVARVLKADLEVARVGVEEVDEVGLEGQARDHEGLQLAGAVVGEPEADLKGAGLGRRRLAKPRRDMVERVGETPVGVRIVVLVEVVVLDARDGVEDGGVRERPDPEDAHGESPQRTPGARLEPKDPQAGERQERGEQVDHVAVRGAAESAKDEEVSRRQRQRAGGEVPQLRKPWDAGVLPGEEQQQRGEIERKVADPEHVFLATVAVGKREPGHVDHLEEREECAHLRARQEVEPKVPVGRYAKDEPAWCCGCRPEIM